MLQRLILRTLIFLMLILGAKEAVTGLDLYPLEVMDRAITEGVLKIDTAAYLDGEYEVSAEIIDTDAFIGITESVLREHINNPTSPEDKMNAQWLYNLTILKNLHDPLDVFSPTISDLSPASGSIVTSPTPTISAILSDTRSGINPATIVMKLDGIQVNPDFDPDSGVVSYTPASLANGMHTVNLDVCDTAGNPAYPTTWHFYVNRKPVHIRRH